MSRIRMLEPGPRIEDPLEPYAQVSRSRADGRGWLMAHMVGGLDGSAAIDGRVGDLSTAPDAELFRLMRALADVVLVGAETVRAEHYGVVRLPPERAAARVAAGRPATPRVLGGQGRRGLNVARPTVGCQVEAVRTPELVRTR